MGRFTRKVELAVPRYHSGLAPVRTYTMTKLYSSETMLLLVAFLLIFIGFFPQVDQKTLSKLLGIYQKLNLIFIRLYPEGKKKKNE